MSNSNGRSNSSNGKATMIMCSIILAIIVGVIIYIIIDKSTDKDGGHHGNHHWYPPRCNTSRGYIWSQRLRRCVRGYYK